MIENTAPQTDANENQLPSQGAPPGAALPSILSGIPKDAAPDLATAFSQLFLTNAAKIHDTSIIAQKAKAAEAAKAQAAQPVQDRTVPPSPGSFGDKLGGAVGGLEASLSDAAHANDTGGGWLAGMTNTLNARQQRLAQQQKDAITMAKAQAENVALHRNFYQQDTAHRQDFYTNNQKFTAKYKVNHETEDGVTQQELFDRAQKDKDFASKYYVRATGEFPVAGADGTQKVDKYGNPVTIPTYSVVSVATKDGSKDDKEIDASQSGEYKKYVGIDYPVGTKLTGKQMYALDTQSKVALNTATVLKNTNGKELSDDQLKVVRPLLSDPTVAHAVSAKPGNAFAGISEAMANADAHISQVQQKAAVAKQQNNQQALDAANAEIASITKERQNLVNFTDAAIAPKQIEDYNKKSDDATAMLTDLQKKADGAHGEEAAAMAASTQKMLDDGTYTDQQKRVLTRIHSQAQAAAQASQDYKLKEEQNKAEATNALAEGDTDTLVDAAKNYQLDPNKLYSMRKNTNAEFKAKLLREDPTWSEAVYKQRYTMNQDLAKDTPNSMGGQVDSLNRFAMHTGSANRGIEGLRNISSPILNLPLNKMKSTMVGFEQAQAFKIEAETAKDEYLTFIKNGHVPPTEQEERLAASVSTDRTPAELQSTFRSMAELVAARAKSMNGRYNTIMGKGNIPGLLQPDTQNILRQFGVDVDAITNTAGTTSFSRPINQVQPPKNVKNPTAGKSADGAAVWQMNDGTIQDAQGNKYNPATGKRL